jgi:hypothetical protein
MSWHIIFAFGAHYDPKHPAPFWIAVGIMVIIALIVIIFNPKK